MSHRGAGVLVLACGILAAQCARAAEVLVEAEAFADRGGWAVDAQFVDEMGSCYLLAHGLGKPVAPAKATVAFPEPGTYHLWVRTLDWVPSHSPGRFRVAVDGAEAPVEFGRGGEGWHWQPGGVVTVAGAAAAIELRDLTGFDGRCDALFFTTAPDAVLPDTPGEAMAAWRRKLLGLRDVPPSAGDFDVVVVGGGIPGCSAALAAGRLGLTVALIQDRPVLGGNASPGFRIGPRGSNRTVVDEVDSNDRQRVLEAEKSVKLHLGWRAIRAATRAGRITSVDAKHIMDGRELRFTAPVFIDCTGAGWLGAAAGADFRVGREAAAEFNESLAPKVADGMHHGNTVVFSTRMANAPRPFPDVPWATAVARDYASLGGLAHFWEYGQWLDPGTRGEHIRDHLMCAVYGTFANVKAADPVKNANLELASVGFVAATGEWRRLMGDYILTEDDIRAQTPFPDAVATNSGHFCLHFPGDRYDFRLGDWKWIGVKPYPVPFRCLYSRNIENLMMAGKHISVSHIAGSSTKTMLNGGQHGVATAAAAYLCKKYGATPRGVYQEHLAELRDIVFEQGAWKDVFKPKPARPGG